ncbi:hypothetical protein [Streptomyces sp. NPDC020681]|uniref:hypothetical protein n=1 Tax=Streptomyces sp. NPDC020681 TaxID=3365083 RepID=UPI0037AFDB6D
MALRFIGIDPDTDSDHCPRVWVDDEAEEFVIQGWKASEALEDQVRKTGPLPDYETVVRIPARMVHIMREACDAVERSDVR